MSAINYGAGLTERQTTENFGGAGQGIQTVRLFEGTRESVAAKRAQLQLAGVRYSWSDKTPAEIIASYSTNALFGILETRSAIDKKDRYWLESRKRLARAEIYRRDKKLN